MDRFLSHRTVLPFAASSVKQASLFGSSARREPEPRLRAGSCLNFRETGKRIRNTGYRMTVQKEGKEAEKCTILLGALDKDTLVDVQAVE